MSTNAPASDSGPMDHIPTFNSVTAPHEHTAADAEANTNAFRDLVVDSKVRLLHPFRRWVSQS